MSAELEKIYEGILDGDMNTVVNGVQKALDDGLSPAEILNQGMIEAMGEVGSLFEEGEYFVPVMLIAARAMQIGLEI